MDSIEFDRIEIIEGFCSGANTNISPARKNPDGPNDYTQNKEQMISIGWLYLHRFLGELLNKYYCKELQLPYYDDSAPYEYYDEYGWNFYTPEQIRSLLADLQNFIDIVSENRFDTRYKRYLMPHNAEKLNAHQCTDCIMEQAAQLTDFYRRFIARMNQMLNSMGDYELILFAGP